MTTSMRVSGPTRLSPRTEEIYNTPLASGFITGEALVLLFLALFAAAGG